MAWARPPCRLSTQEAEDEVTIDPPAIHAALGYGRRRGGPRRLRPGCRARAGSRADGDGEEFVIKHPIIQDPQGVDPNNPLTPPNKTFGTMYHDGLYRLTRAGIEPNLATALPAVDNDGRRWTIPLREGVKFHNGAAFTAADVKYSLDFIKENSLSTSSLLVNIEEVSVQDDHTLVIDLAAPDSFLLSAMSVTDGPRIVAEGAYDGAPVEKEGLQTALTSSVDGTTTGPTS